MVYNRFRKVVTRVLTLACMFCIVTVECPFCVYIFHELEEPDGINEWRIRHGRKIGKNYD